MFPVLFLIFVLIFSFFNHWLNFKGLLALFFIGCLVIFLAPIPFWGMLIFVFVVSSSLKKVQVIWGLKENPFEAKSAKRDGMQVLANTLVPLLCFLLANFYSTFKLPFYFAASCSLGTAFCDTLASEIGLFSKGATFTLLGQKIQKGRSGGISMLGTFSSFLGGILFSGLTTSLFLLFSPQMPPFWWMQSLFLIFFSFLGMLLDSFLGLFQGLYLTKNAEVTEKKTSHLISGKSFLTNDFVNFLSQFLIGILSYTLAVKCGWF